MAEEESREIDTGGGAYTEGRITAGNDFIGRDQINQYIQLDIPKLIETLRQTLPAGDPTPQHLAQALKDFKRFHACLHEWKELHNCLNDITYALGQFSREVERLDAAQETPDRRKLSRQWRPVAQKLDVLLEWSASLQNISSVVYSESPQGISGPSWAVKLQVARRRLEDLFQRAAIDPLELYDAAADFSDQADLQMYLADKSLRETAGELYSLSQIVLGSLGNEPLR